MLVISGSKAVKIRQGSLQKLFAQPSHTRGVNASHHYYPAANPARKETDPEAIRRYL